MGIIGIGVGVYIINPRHKILLGLRRGAHGNGTWSPPGGSLNFNESFESCAIRECAEETSMHITADDLTVMTITNDIHAVENRHMVTVHVRAHHYTGTPIITEPDKCAEWAWFDLNALPAPLFLPAKTFLQSPHARVFLA